LHCIKLFLVNAINLQLKSSKEGLALLCLWSLFSRKVASPLEKIVDERINIYIITVVDHKYIVRKQGCQISLCKTYQKQEIVYQMNTTNTKWTQHIPNEHYIYQMAVHYSKWPTNIPTYHSKALNNIPKLGYLV
jgi:hypothetical protein